MLEKCYSVTYSKAKTLSSTPLKILDEMSAEVKTNFFTPHLQCYAWADQLIRQGLCPFIFIIPLLGAEHLIDYIKGLFYSLKY